MRTKIINGRLITPYRILEGWELTLEGGVIASVGPREGQRDGHCRLLDATGRYVAPGFIDLHTLWTVRWRPSAARRRPMPAMGQPR